MRTVDAHELCYRTTYSHTFGHSMAGGFFLFRHAHPAERALPPPDIPPAEPEAPAGSPPIGNIDSDVKLLVPASRWCVSQTLAVECGGRPTLSRRNVFSRCLSSHRTRAPLLAVRCLLSRQCGGGRSPKDCCRCGLPGNGAGRRRAGLRVFTEAVLRLVCSATTRQVNSLLDDSRDGRKWTRPSLGRLSACDVRRSLVPLAKLLVLPGETDGLSNGIRSTCGA